MLDVQPCAKYDRQFNECKTWDEDFSEHNLHIDCSRAWELNTHLQASITGSSLPCINAGMNSPVNIRTADLLLQLSYILASQLMSKKIV